MQSPLPRKLMLSRFIVAIGFSLFVHLIMIFLVWKDFNRIQNTASPTPHLVVEFVDQTSPPRPLQGNRRRDKHAPSSEISSPEISNTAPASIDAWQLQSISKDWLQQHDANVPKKDFTLPKNDPRFESNDNLQSQSSILADAYRISPDRLLVKLRLASGKIICFEVPERDYFNEFDNRTWMYKPNCS